MIARNDYLEQGSEEDTYRTRVVVANEPRSYREAFAAAFQALRPHLEVIVIEPEDLYREVRRTHPQIVVCGRITSDLKNRIPYWIEFYVEDETITVQSNVQTASTGAEVGFGDLIAIIDEAEKLLGAEES